MGTFQLLVEIIIIAE